MRRMRTERPIVAVNLKWALIPRENSLGVRWAGQSRPATDRPCIFPSFVSGKDRKIFILCFFSTLNRVKVSFWHIVVLSRGGASSWEQKGSRERDRHHSIKYAKLHSILQKKRKIARRRTSTSLPTIQNTFFAVVETLRSWDWLAICPLMLSRHSWR